MIPLFSILGNNSPKSSLKEPYWKYCCILNPIQYNERELSVAICAFKKEEMLEFFYQRLKFYHLQMKSIWGQLRGR